MYVREGGVGTVVGPNPSEEERKQSNIGKTHKRWINVWHHETDEGLDSTLRLDLEQIKVNFDDTNIASELAGHTGL